MRQAEIYIRIGMVYALIDKARAARFGWIADWRLWRARRVARPLEVWLGRE